MLILLRLGVISNEQAFAGQFVTHQAFWPAGLWGALEETPYKLDVAKGKELLAKAASGTPLDEAQAAEAFDIMMSGDATPAQMGGFLMALRVRGETVAEILARANADPNLEPITAESVAGLVQPERWLIEDQQLHLVFVQRRQDVLDLAGADSKGQGAKRTMSGCVAVAADDCHAGLG